MQKTPTNAYVFIINSIIQFIYT